MNQRALAQLCEADSRERQAVLVCAQRKEQDR